MIDKITITLQDDGVPLVDIGGIHIIRCHSTNEVLQVINESIGDLAYFKTTLLGKKVDPISYEEFQKRKKEALKRVSKIK